jgi:hypothetical protein
VICAAALLVALLGLCATAAPVADAAHVVALGKGFPLGINESDHVVLGQLVEEEGEEGKIEENFEGPWSIWAEGKSSTLKPLNGAEKHEKGEEPRHELVLGGSINAAGDVAGTSTQAFTDEGKERITLRPVWFGPKGEAHEVPILQEYFTNNEGEAFHLGGYGAGIDDAGDVVGTDGVQPSPAADVESRGVFAASGGGPVTVGEADRPPGSQTLVALVNASGEMLGAVNAYNAQGEVTKTTYYLWPNASSAGTALNYDLPYALADDGSTLGERGGSFYLRTPDGKETAVTGIEKPFRLNSSHAVVGQLTVSGNAHAALWQSGSVTDLNSQLPKGSGWTLERAVAINDSGDIAGVGTHEGKQEAFLLEAGEDSATAITCKPSATAGTSTCTAKVSDASGEQPPKTPTGSVTFSATAPSGSPPSFKEPKCELKPTATPGTAECSAAYQESAGGGQVTISAAYGGDAEFAASSATLTQCAGGADLELEGVKWVGRHDHGFEIGKEATLKGCGLAAGEVVQWGNDEAKETLDAANVNADGTSATTTVPWNATTGKLSITDGQTTATLNEEQTVDSWRNSQGFKFANFTSPVYPAEMVKAFPGSQITDPKTAAVLAPYERFFKQRAKEPGRCYGFAFLSSALAEGAFPVDRFGEVQDPYELPTTEALTEEINLDWWKQFADEADPYLELGLKNTSGADIRSQLEAAFGPNGFYHPAIVSINWWGAGDDLQGHALTAFAVRETPTEADPGEFTIYAYDSNTPFKEVEDTDVAEHAGGLTNSNIIVHGNGSWYDAKLKAGGTPIMLHVTPIAALEGTLHLTFKGHVATAVSAETRVESVTDPATGKPVDLEGGGSSDVALIAEQDGGPSARPASTGPGRGGVSEIFGPLGSWSEALSNTAGPVAATFLTGGLAGDLEATSGHDNVVFDSAGQSLALSPVTGQPSSHSATISLMAGQADGGEHILTVSGPAAQSKLKASFRGGVATVTAPTAGRFDVKLSVEGNGIAWQTYDAGTIAIGAGQTLTLKPASWSRLESGHLAATLTKGAHRRAVRLRNRFRAPAAKAIAAARAGKGLSVTVSLPPLDASSSQVALLATIRHAGRVVGHVGAPVALGARRRTVLLSLATAIPTGFSVQLQLSTYTYGRAPSTATTTRTFTIRR